MPPPSDASRAAALRSVLEQGAAALGESLTADTVGGLLAYREELERWNAAYNLTAIREPEAMVVRHLLDSLAVLPALDAAGVSLGAARLLDVGSGAGLPGLVLALCRPELSVTVLDSNGKKARFMRHAQRALRLENVEVVESRVEAYAPASRFDWVISRAFASLGDFVRLTEPLLIVGGRWLAMKGKLADDELRTIDEGAVMLKTLPLRVPGLDEARHLIVLGRR